MQTIETYDQEGSAVSRLHFWRVAVAMANANPFLGVGPDCYRAAYNAYDFKRGGHGKRRAVHSAFFGVLAELGYVGAALYGGILFSAVRSCQRVRKLVAPHPQLLPLSQSATALETSLIVFLVGGNFINIQFNEMLWHYIGFTIVLEGLAIQYVSAAVSVPSAVPQVAAIETPVS
jgi:O-antigen ligase